MGAWSELSFHFVTRRSYSLCLSQNRNWHLHWPNLTWDKAGAQCVTCPPSPGLAKSIEPSPKQTMRESCEIRDEPPMRLEEN